ncbi:MAG: hypothetical protein U9Q74_15645 [Gemmatimonadota bacterium]|nr:hypothetical protein [Gemmatimonadota bacterium]
MLNAVTLSLAAMLAVGPGKPAPRADDPNPNADPTSFVLIENDRHVPVEMFVETPEGERSLGVAAENAVTPMRIDAVVTSLHEVSFTLDPLDEPVEATGLVRLEPGKGVAIKIPKRW